MSFDPQLPPACRPEASRGRDVVCVGTALVDHLVHVPDHLPASLGFEKGSMNLVDGAASAEIRASVGEGRSRSGGTVANTAVGVASLGGASVFVGAVAADDDGHGYAADLQAAGVEAILERHEPGEGDRRTGRCVVMVTPDAERTMATALGVGPYLDHGAIDAALVGSAKLAYLDGYALDFPDGEAIVERLVTSAAAAGTVLSFGLADPFVVDRHRSAIERLVAGPVNLLFANEEEATALTGTPDAVAAAGALVRDGLVVVVTRGAKGALVATDGHLVEVEAEPVEAVVDATGAGDLFAAGFTFGVSQGFGLERSARLGALAASEVIGHLGARPEATLAKLAAARGLLAG